MRHGEDEFGAFAILEVEEVLPHDGFAAGLLPELYGVERGQEKLLADLVHLFADDANDLIERALAEGEVAVNASAQLADVAGAEKKLMTGDFGVCRSFAEGGDK